MDHDRYATVGAVEDSRILGLNLRFHDWRDVFLAITDTLDDGQLSTGPFVAAYVGPVRDGERWGITMRRGTRFDVLHDPVRAMIYRVAMPRDQAGAMAPAPKSSLLGGNGRIEKAVQG